MTTRDHGVCCRYNTYLHTQPTLLTNESTLVLHITNFTRYLPTHMSSLPPLRRCDCWYFLNDLVVSFRLVVVVFPSPNLSTFLIHTYASHHLPRYLTQVVYIYFPHHTISSIYERETTERRSEKRINGDTFKRPISLTTTVCIDSPICMTELISPPSPSSFSLFLVFYSFSPSDPSDSFHSILSIISSHHFPRKCAT